MPKVSVYNQDGQPVGEIELSERVFGAPVNEALLHQAVVVYLNNQRQGTASTKTRGEVRGGGRKPWRQKGLGRARHGSIRSPIWVGGGVVFGPKPREYRQQMPQKARQAALRSALSAKVQAGELVVVDELRLAQPKTREMGHILRRLNADRKPLIVLGDRSPNVELSARNLPGAGTAQARDVNVYEVLAHDKLVLTRDAVAKLEEALG
ncbi:MAG: 50S ribosomal protein L4 [Firmicutes bacterium]|nr:50S ribosomal protein L4 [Bacillota bacterium]